MASLDKRGNSLYRIRWYENGKLKSKTFKSDSYKDALDAKRQKEDEVQRAKSSNMRLTELWQLYKQARPRRNNEKHEEAYINRAIEFFSDCYIYEISDKSVNDFKYWLLKQQNKNYKKKKVLLSSTYANACLKKLQAIWNYGIQEKLIGRENDIFLGFKFPCKTKEVLFYQFVNSTIYEVNLLLRQSSIGMTERYSHLVPDQIDERKVDFLREEEPAFRVNNKRFKLNPIAPNIFKPIE